MRKLIGTITIILVLYLGFFGSEKYNIEPFIINWFKSDKPAKTAEKAKEIGKIIFDGDTIVKETI